MKLNFYTLTPLFLICSMTAVVNESAAQSCSDDEVGALVAECRVILQDVKGTYQIGLAKEQEAYEMAKVAMADGAKCIYDVVSIVKDCKPPNINPMACANSLLGVPDVISGCNQAIDKALKAKDLYRQAADFYGTADVAFSDQGGNDVLSQLRACNQNGCFHASEALRTYINEGLARSNSNQQKLDTLIAQIRSKIDILKMCEDNAESCNKDHGGEYNAPGLDAPPGEINLPAH